MMNKYISKIILTIGAWSANGIISNSIIPTMTIDTALLQIENIDIAMNISKFDGTVRGFVFLVSAMITYFIWRTVIKSAFNK